MAVAGLELINCLVKKEEKKKPQNTNMMFKLKQNYYVYQAKGWINVGEGEVYFMNSDCLMGNYLPFVFRTKQFLALRHSFNQQAHLMKCCRIYLYIKEVP